MAHVATDLDTKASPEAVMQALTDFSQRRFEIWPNIDRKFYKLDSADQTSAEVTEGSNSPLGAVWEHAHYDWSRPGVVRIDVKDSNTFQPGSYWQYNVTRRPDGGSHVHMEFDRRPRNLRGQILSLLFNVGGKAVFTKSLGETLHRLETSSAGGQRAPD